MTLTEDHRDKKSVEETEDEIDVGAAATDAAALKLHGENPLAEEEQIKEDDTKAD